MKVPTIALALAALIALYGGSSTTHALTAKTIEKNCKALTVCYKGGVTANPCTIAESTCPACVTFENSGCFEMTSTGTCSFGSLCNTYWEEDDSSTSTSSGSGSSTAHSKSSSSEAGTPAATKNTTTNSTTASSSSAAGAGAGAAGSSASDSGGSDMSVVFAIIGAAMGVIAVAIIFLTLVRRSRAAHEDEDDAVATPPAAMGKDPVSTTAAVTYASYARGRGTSGATGGVPVAEAASTTNVASYYSQQPKDLPIASPRVAGRAVPAATAIATAASTSSVVNYYAQQPQNLPATSPRVAGRAVPASAPRPQPVPAPAPAPRAMPMFANKAPLSNPHQQQYQSQQEVVYQQQAPVVVQVQEAPRRVSSPRNRRESFEF